MSSPYNYNLDPRLERAPDVNNSLLHRTWKSFGKAAESTKHWLKYTGPGECTVIAGMLVGVGLASYAIVFGPGAILKHDPSSSNALLNTTVSASVAEEVLIESHQNYLIGVHAGMITAGVEISDQTNARMTNFVQKDPVRGKYTNADEVTFMKMRNLGAIAGAAGVTEAELMEYIDFVEGLSDSLAQAKTRQAAMFDGMEGISSGERISTVAQVLGIAGDNWVEGGTTDQLLDNIVLTAFDEGYLPSKAEVEALRSKITEAMAEVQQIAESEDIVAALQAGLLERNMTAFASDRVSIDEVIAECPFRTEVTTNDPSCAPER